MHSDDHPFLAKIFFPNDPDRVLFFENNSLKNKDLASASGVIALGEKPMLPGWQCLRFDYVNNPGGGIRWLYPAGLRRPLFLKLYNGSGWRGFLFKHAFRGAFRLGLRSAVKSGTLHVFFKNNLPLAERIGQDGAGEYAIFTGTVGENRKAVIFLQDDPGEWFFKLPFNATSAALVRNEERALSQLEPLHLKKMAVPKAVPSGEGLLLSNVEPRSAVNSFDLQAVHFQALAELSEKTLEMRPLGDLPFWGDTGEWLAALPEQPILNDLPAPQVERVIGLLCQLRDSFDPGQPVPVTLAHGDFTPWNLFAAEDRLHVYDWELSERLPLLFDAFHFVFQSGVLVKRQPFHELEAAIFSIKENREVQLMLEAAGSSFQFLFSLYLLRNVSYYLLRYLRQSLLHEQAKWLLAAWDEALTGIQATAGRPAAGVAG